MTDTTTETDAEAQESHRRHAAGENPAKRDQILDGAACVFMEKGFDGASMNDICRAAGVSKGTLYVYYADKLELFEAIIARERERLMNDMQAILDADTPLRERLTWFGRRLAEKLCSEKVIRAQRIIVGVAEKMPELGARFYETGARRTQGRLALLIEREAAAGRLSVPDPALAAVQFVDLATGPLWRPLLFAAETSPPESAEIDRVVESAVEMFFRTYAAG